MDALIPLFATVPVGRSLTFTVRPQALQPSLVARTGSWQMSRRSTYAMATTSPDDDPGTSAVVGARLRAWRSAFSDAELTGR
jgi:hypothetical protein